MMLCKFIKEHLYKAHQCTATQTGGAVSRKPFQGVYLTKYAHIKEVHKLIKGVVDSSPMHPLHV